MKHMVLLLTDMETHLEFEGAFSTINDVVQHLWSMYEGKSFTAWDKIKDNRSNSEDIKFVKNMANIKLLRAAEDPKFAGLGPLDVRRVWVEQNGFHGDFPHLVVSFVATDARDMEENVEVAAVGELRRIRSPQGPVFTHESSALGQQIEETIKLRLSEKVETSLKRIRGVVLHNDPFGERTLQHQEIIRSLRKQLDDRSFLCERCIESIIPGVIFPSGVKTDKAYVCKCSECDLFNDDASAAISLSHVLQAKPVVDDDGCMYLEGMTYEEAKRWGRTSVRQRSE